MRRHNRFLLLGGVALAGCFHATVETGVPPSHVVVEKRWASGWILGLVPPSTVATASRCPSGVSRIETRLSFLNQVVSALTLSLYTPMAIKVTCAEASPAPGPVAPRPVAAHFPDSLPGFSPDSP